MDFQKLTRLRQAEIATPCGEDWDAMAGDDQQRFCAGCGCFVHNLAAMKADEAEELLAKPERVCTRMMVDTKRGILTRDGWVPRLMLAGAIAVSAVGCSEKTYVGEGVGTPAATTTQQTFMGDVAPPKVEMGKMPVAPEPKVESKKAPR